MKFLIVGVLLLIVGGMIHWHRTHAAAPDRTQICLVKWLGTADTGHAVIELFCMTRAEWEQAQKHETK